jgi:hypothetical protein
MTRVRTASFTSSSSLRSTFGSLHIRHWGRRLRWTWRSSWAHLLIPKVVWRVLLLRAKRYLSVSSTVGSLVGHAQGSGQLLGMHTLPHLLKKNINLYNLLIVLCFLYHLQWKRILIFTTYWLFYAFYIICNEGLKHIGIWLVSVIWSHRNRTWQIPQLGDLELAEAPAGAPLIITCTKVWITVTYHRDTISC